MALNVEDSLGALFFGNMLCYLLYGITCAQTLYYFYHYQNDQYLLRAWVALLWVIDTAKLATDIHQLWFYVVIRHDSFFALIEIDRVLIGEQILTTILLLSVQGYFLNRNIKLLKTTRGKCLFASVVILPFLLNAGSNFWAIYNCVTDPTIGGTISKQTGAALISSISALVTDFCITCAFCYTLRGSTSGFDRTRYILSRLLNYLVSRGIVLCLAMLLLLSVYVFDIRNGTVYSEIVHMPIGTLYANSLLAVLNVRHHLGNPINDDFNPLPLSARSR
ncbi:hypothetical protein C8Q72DRAFT_804386 [Fomitopsis betulina]|nr:hypothetical protein C8Q72DRAFT_804386 [Fomitopsis betulina]